jgi:hypothetical protein
MEYLDKFVVVFIDDILVLSKTEEEPETSVGKAQSTSTICQVQQMQILVIGSGFSWACHISWRSFSGSWMPPTNVSEIRSFLGLAGYY